MAEYKNDEIVDVEVDEEIEEVDEELEEEPRQIEKKQHKHHKRRREPEGIEAVGAWWHHNWKKVAVVASAVAGAIAIGFGGRAVYNKHHANDYGYDGGYDELQDLEELERLEAEGGYDIQ